MNADTATNTHCPLQCGFEGRLCTHEAAGVTIFVCPECLGVTFDGGVLCDTRKSLDLSRLLKPIIANVIRENSIDPLTQVKNRRFFLHRLATELANARHRHFLSVAAFRIYVGHDFHAVSSRSSDTIMQSVAAIILAMVRAGDNFARVDVDTDSFCLILPNADVERAEEIAERIAKAASARVYHDHVNQRYPIEFYHTAILAGSTEMPEEVLKRLLNALLLEDHHGA
mgnify:FL=1